MKIETRPFKVNYIKEVEGKQYRIPFQFWTVHDELKVLEEWDKRVLGDSLKEAIEVIDYIRSVK